MRLIALLAALALPALSQVPHQKHGKHMPSGDYARVLDDPSREKWQKPHEVVMALGLRSDEVVADIGAGTGYFAKRFAHHAGTVYAVDIEPKLLATASKGAPENLKTIVAAMDDPKLPAGSIDTIFFCDVMHHIDNRDAYLAKLKTALKPQGRLVIIDFYKKQLPVGPPPSMKIEREEMIAEITKAGFTLDKEHKFLPHQYFLEFRSK
jgi:ubiquinone/menaquinone biosynthesis C-methylase UbiE